MNVPAHARTLAATLLAFSCGLAQAQETASIAWDVEARITTDQRNRGISDSLRKPAARLGITAAHESGVTALLETGSVSRKQFLGGSGLFVVAAVGYRAGDPDGWHYGVGAAHEAFPGASFEAPHALDPATFAPVDLRRSHFNSSFLALEAGWGALESRLMVVTSKTYRGANTGGVCGTLLAVAADPTPGLACYARGDQGSRGTLLLDVNYRIDLDPRTTVNLHLGHQRVKHFHEADTTDHGIGPDPQTLGLCIHRRMAGGQHPRPRALPGARRRPDARHRQRHPGADRRTQVLMTRPPGRDDQEHAMNTSQPVALVTGSTGGIGACVAEALAARGYRLVLMDLDRTGLEQQAARHLGARIETLDLARQDAVLDWARALHADDAAPVDLAFVNAGLIAVGEVVDLPTDKLLLQLQVNLVSTAILVQALAQRMAAAGRGHLIATVSMGGIVSLKGSAAYSASKFGLRGLLWGLRDELRPRGVHVCGIYPAGVDTPMLRHEARHGGSALNFVGQPVTAEDVARAVMSTIDRPRLETYVPASEGITGRLAGAFPGLLAGLYPWLEKMGERGRAAYLARLARDGH